MEENKAIVRDSYEVIFNQREFHRLHEFYAADYFDPGGGPSTGVKQDLASAMAGVPDLRVSIVELVAEADKVAVAWTLQGIRRAELSGAPAPGLLLPRQGVALYRLAAGRIVERMAGTSPMLSLRVGLPESTSVSRSTERSRALLEEVVRLIPELDDRSRLFDFEYALEGRRVTAGAERTYPELGRITVHIAVGAPGAWRLPCTPGSSVEPCTRIEQFPDGSTAYLRSSIVPNTVGHCYSVTLVKPDGTGVSVSSLAYRPEHADMPDAPLSLDRVLEVARQITVTP
ncbi:ester cyclase [Kribbella sp. CA-253562]|uniref:ester cyclase n=1 Tax=Kribbella sp. CA-253562 TaxID=3239942 RepID=UPI003D9000AA